MARVETVVVPKPEFDALVAQRDTLLAALREILKNIPGQTAAEMRHIARAAISEVEGET